MGSRDYLQTAPWLLAAPGAAIFITVMISNLMGDSLRDILDPYESAAQPIATQQKKERPL
jgi:peptide/nickel transport system permease protein